MFPPGASQFSKRVSSLGPTMTRLGRFTALLGSPFAKIWASHLFQSVVGGQAQPTGPFGHPAVADIMIKCLSDPRGLRHFSAAAARRDALRAVGYDAPLWRPLATAQPRFLAERLQWALATPEHGWQREASTVVETYFAESSIVPQLL